MIQKVITIIIAIMIIKNLVMIVVIKCDLCCALHTEGFLKPAFHNYE